jgi:hypothetical protein
MNGLKPQSGLAGCLFIVSQIRSCKIRRVASKGLAAVQSTCSRNKWSAIESAGLSHAPYIAMELINEVGDEMMSEELRSTKNKTGTGGN